MRKKAGDYMAAGYDGSIRIDTKIDTKSFNTGVNGITKSLKTLGATLGVAFSVKAVIDLGRAAIDTASDIQEVQNVVDTAFGSMSDQVEEFASTAIDNFGMSELAAKRTASTYMAMSKGMGIAGQAAADMAIDVAGLTGDVASFYNVSQDVADTALKSIWTGETESLKQFGVVMTQANLQQFAYTQGINKKISAMSQAEQVMLRYQYVTNQLSLAQGDFAKTSGSWANQTRILSERWKELLGLLGSGLIEVGLPIVKALNTILELIINILKKIGQLYTAITGKKLVASNDKVADSANNAADAESNFADGIGEATKAAKGALAAFDDLDVLQNDIGSGGGGDGINLSFPDDFGGEIQEAESDIKGLKDEFNNFFFVVNDKFKGLGDTLAIPIRVPLPIFAELPSPIYNPNWGLNLPTLKTPIFPPIKDPVYEPNWGLNPPDIRLPQIPLLPSPVWLPNWGLEVPEIKLPKIPTFPSPVWVPNWNINATLTPELELSSQGFQTWKESMQTTFSEAVTNMGLNASELKNTILQNTDGWTLPTKASIRAWGLSAAAVGLSTAKNFAYNIGEALSTTSGDITDWANTTSSDLVKWGNRAVEIAADTGRGILRNISNGLKTAWSNFVDAMIAMGEKISGGFHPSFNYDAVVGIGITALTIGKIFKGTRGNFIPAAIPMHAKGAVIPPNSEYLAILGDQKSGKNIEAPEGLIRKIIKEELSGLNVSGQEVTINFAGNMSQLVRVLKPYIDKENSRVGTKLVIGGA